MSSCSALVQWSFGRGRASGQVHYSWSALVPAACNLAAAQVSLCWRCLLFEHALWSLLGARYALWPTQPPPAARHRRTGPAPDQPAALLRRTLQPPQPALGLPQRAAAPPGRRLPRRAGHQPQPGRSAAVAGLFARGAVPWHAHSVRCAGAWWRGGVGGGGGAVA